MKKNLTKTDVQVLRSRCSLGYFIAFAIFILGEFIGITIYESFIDAKPGVVNYQMALVIGVALLLLSVITLFILNRKYFIDLRNNEKIQILKTLQNKNSTTDYYKNTITRRLYFEVDNVQLEVDKNMYESCESGDKLTLNYAPKSKLLLGFEKYKSTQ